MDDLQLMMETQRIHDENVRLQTELHMQAAEQHRQHQHRQHQHQHEANDAEMEKLEKEFIQWMEYIENKKLD